MKWGYDSPRLFTVDQVVAAARFLDATPFAALAQHYEPTELAVAQVYPDIWDQAWALSYLEDYYTRLAALFHAAAIDGEPVLVWMD